MNSNLPYVIRFVSFPATRLMDNTGQYHQSIKTDDALKIARGVGLDLVCFNKPDIGALAFCKIIDFGKWKYDEEKRKKKEQKHSRKESKEVRFSAAICENDIAHKVKQVNDFLDEGATVTLTMKLHGRERAHFDLAAEKMNQIAALCSGHGKEVGKKSEGGMIIVRLTSLGEHNTTPTQQPISEKI